MTRRVKGGLERGQDGQATPAAARPLPTPGIPRPTEAISPRPEEAAGPSATEWAPRVPGSRQERVNFPVPELRRREPPTPLKAWWAPKPAAPRGDSGRRVWKQLFAAPRKSCGGTSGSGGTTERPRVTSSSTPAPEISATKGEPR